MISSAVQRSKHCTAAGAGGCIYSWGPWLLSITSLPQTHQSTWMHGSFALIVQYATVNKINIYTRFFWEMSYEQICSVATELIVGSLNVNDTIRATLELLKHGAAGQPASLALPQGNSRAIQRRLHLWQTPFPIHPSCLPNLDIHYQVCPWMQLLLLGHLFFLDPFPHLTLFCLPLPFYPPLLHLFAAHSPRCNICVRVMSREWVFLVSALA